MESAALWFLCVQRLCELLLDPHRVYTTSTRKLMNAAEKLLTVSSTVPIMQVAAAKPGSYQVRLPASPDCLLSHDSMSSFIPALVSTRLFPSAGGC